MRSLRAGVALVAVAVAAALALVVQAGAIVPPIPSQEAVRATAEGVVWRTGDGVELDQGATRTTLVTGLGLPGVDPGLEGNGRYVAVRVPTGLLVGAPPQPLTALARGPRQRGGCAAWRADPIQSGPFAVGSSTLVIPGRPACSGTQPSGPRPLFAYAFASKRWSTVARLASSADPQLAASGRWLAVGTQTAATSMLVEVIDLRSGRVSYRTTVAPGYLDVDENGRVLVAVPQFGTLQSQPSCCNATYRMTWLSRGTPHVHPLTPVVVGLPGIASGRLAYVTDNGDASTTLKVTTLHSGATQDIIGFRPVQRELYAFDLYGNTLALVEAETPPPAPGQTTCYQIAPSGPQTLAEVNLALPITPIAAPPAPPPIDPAEFFARCGPVPP